MITSDSENEKQVQVRVIDKYRVVDDNGRGYTKGDTAEVPEVLAEVWIRNRWVERVTATNRGTSHKAKEK